MLEAAVLLQALIGEYLESRSDRGSACVQRRAFLRAREAGGDGIGGTRTRLALTGFVLEDRLKTYIGSPRYDALPVKE